MWKNSLSFQEVAVVIDVNVPPPIQDLLEKGPTMVLSSLPSISDLAPSIDQVMEGYDDTFKEMVRWELIYNRNSIHRSKEQ